MLPLLQSLRHIIVTGLALLIPIGVGALSVAEPYPVPSFYDVSPGAWYATYVEQAASLGIVSGYKDQYGNFTGFFGPEKPVTIGEALKIGLESAGYDVSTENVYGHWAAPYISRAIKERFGVTINRTVYLDSYATRGEMASIINDAFRVAVSIPKPIPYDDVTVNTPYAEAIQSLSSDGILSGDTDAAGHAIGRYRPWDGVKRAEVVKIAILARLKYGEQGRSSSSSSSSVSSSSSSRSSVSSSLSACTLQACGLAPGMPNWYCPDGSVAGPSCERLPDSRCGWIIRNCPVSSASSSSSRSSSSSSRSSSVSSLSSAYSGQTYIINYTPNGFSPTVIQIRVGDSISFWNYNSNIGLWVASNPHPTHIDYPSFDAHGSSSFATSYTFKFTKAGTFGYHNHLYPSHQGTVNVSL